ncbi:MAG: biotin--[Bacteroides sp.]|nr:biotin--[acetyl-CoA-carboxylase] ligase [Bacteroides sp.]
MMIHLNETDSTNRYLQQLCQEAVNNKVEEFTTVCADYQTAGKGQRGNSWEAAKGANLLFSFVCYPTFVPIRQQFVLSQLISLGIKETLDEYCSDISIKWPNDIYWKEKKICGILIENDLQGNSIGRCISGIGLNINQEVFLSDAPNPISLKQITGKHYQRETILEKVMQRIEQSYQKLKEDSAYASELATRYAASLFRREGLHCYQDKDGLFNARLVRVEADGRFVLMDEANQERSYLFKEVQYVL